MNIAVLVGHPSSGFEEVECQLSQCGVNGAMPSQGQGRLPKDITDALCRAHSSPRLDTVESVSCFKQYEAEVVWHGMALDLLLGNLDEMQWGWSDPQCVFWLEYWKTLVPQITFILVYNEPHSALSHAGLSDFENKCGPATEQLLANWKAYNEALLEFFLHNRERCVLVHSQQVPHSLDVHLSQLRSHLNGTAESRESGLRLPDAGRQNVLKPGSAEKPQMPTIRALNQRMGNSEKNPLVLDMVDHGDSLGDFILRNVINLYPDCQHLYQELHSVANLPHVATRESEHSGEPAWVSLLKQEKLATGIIWEIQRRHQKLSTLADQRLRQIGELTSHAKNLDAELSTTKCLLSYIQDQLEECYSQYLELRDENEDKNREIKELAQQQEAIIGEKDHMIQEFSCQITDLKEKQQYLTARIDQAAAYTAQRVKQQLSYRLGYTIVSGSRTMRGRLGMPLAVCRTITLFYRERREKAASSKSGDHQQVVTTHISNPR